MKCLKPVLLSMLLATCGGANGADRPNIIIFLADDLGYADLGCQGCKDIPTPHIDSLAKNGVRFTDGYATHPVCAPSRAGLMTGMYQHRFGFEHNPGPERFAAPNFGLPRSVPTLAEKLKGAGYATCMVGKWHLGFKEGCARGNGALTISSVFLAEHAITIRITRGNRTCCFAMLVQ